jgi:hypothetical protein
MFAKNVGTIDRAVRIIVGLGLLAGFFLNQSESPWTWLYLIGIVPLATGLMGSCGLYSVLGISTCPVKR